MIRADGSRAILVLALALVAAPAIPGMAIVTDEPAPPLWEKTAKIADPDELGTFGEHVALDGDTLVASHAVSGCGNETNVHIFERGASGWVETQRLSAPQNPHDDPDATFGDSRGEDPRCFGNALALDADAGVLVVGDTSLSVDGNVTHHEAEAGAVYVYERQPNGTWELVADFYGPVNGDFNDWPPDDEIHSLGPSFGRDVATDGETIVASANAAVVDGEWGRGSVTVIEKVDGNWTRTAEFTSSNPYAKAGDHFGMSVAVRGDTFAVGSEEGTSSSGTHEGTVHVYRRSEDGWQHQGVLAPPWVTLGPLKAPPNHEAGRDVRGECYEAVEDAQRQVWHPLGEKACKLRDGQFGVSVAFDEEESTLVVGDKQSTSLAGVSPPEDWPVGQAGVVYVFQQASNVAVGYEHAATLENPEPGRNDLFGHSVDVDEDGDTIAVGGWEDAASGHPGHLHGVTTTGLAWVFEKTGGQWQCADRLSPDPKHGVLVFGYDVEVSQDTIATGASLEDDGNVYLFEETETGPDGVLERQQSPCGHGDDARWLTGSG